MSKGLTQGDLHSIHYFIQEKGDVTRWSGWERHRTEALELFPLLGLYLKHQKEVEALERAILSELEEGF